jgi:hypothetical protein
MTYLQLVPATLSLVILAAHFLRSGSLLVVFLVVLVRQPWAGRALQWVLVIGAIEWLRTLVVLTSQRRLEGLPYTRMALILAAVGVFTLSSALLVSTRRAKVHFREEPATSARS